MDGKTKSRLTILHTNDMHGRYRSIPVVKGSATSQTGDPGRTWDEFDRGALREVFQLCPRL